MYQPGMTLEESERETIIAALQYHCGNRTHAAASLAITKKTLQNKIRKYKEQGHKIMDSTYHNAEDEDEVQATQSR